jgi:hypothetical protein
VKESVQSFCHSFLTDIVKLIEQRAGEAGSALG